MIEILTQCTSSLIIHAGFDTGISARERVKHQCYMERVVQLRCVHVLQLKPSVRNFSRVIFDFIVACVL